MYNVNHTRHIFGLLSDLCPPVGPSSDSELVKPESTAVLPVAWRPRSVPLAGARRARRTLVIGLASCAVFMFVY
jgi:hypothetical protein|eukprot:7304734-Prymnesium_polylepis.1